MASAKVYILADTRGFHLGMKRAKWEAMSFAQKMTVIGGGAQQVGRSMTRNVSMPILAIGAASTVMALQYDKAMHKIAGLTGASAQEMALYREEVLKIAPAVAKGPKELADALYLIRSSGIKGAEALDVLTQAGKASSSGLGETKIIADAMTSAINAYGPAVLSATRSVDVMIASVREGKMPAEAFAGSLGTVLPVAAKLKVQFDEVGAAIASMSRIGQTPESSGHALTQMLVNLLKPTAQGAETMKKAGTSYEKIRQEIVDKGLLKAMVDLNVALDSSSTKAATIFSRRGLTTFFTITDPKRLKKTSKLFGEIAGSGGSLAKAWGIMSEDPYVKLQMDLAKVESMAIKIGDALIPMLMTVMDEVGNIADAFNGLDENTQHWIVKLGIALALLGPLSTGAGTLLKGGGFLLGRRAASTAAGAAAGSAAPAAIAAVTGGTTTVTGGAAASTGSAIASGFTASLAASAAGVGAMFAAPIIGAAVLEGQMNKDLYDRISAYSDAMTAQGKEPGDWGRKRLGKATGAFTAPTEEQVTGAQWSPVIGGLQAQIQAQVPSATLAQFKVLMKDYTNLQAVLEHPLILGDVESEKTLGEIRSIRDRLIGELGMTKKAANRIVKGMFGSIPGEVKTNVSKGAKNFDKLVAGMEKSGNRSVKELSRAMAKLPGIAGTQAEKAARQLGKLKIDGQPIGYNFALSLARGIVAGNENAIIAAVRLAEAVKTGVKGHLMIDSPSKVGIEIGRNFSESVGIGIDAGVPKTLRAVSRMSGRISAASAPRHLSRAGAGGLHLHVHGDVVGIEDLAAYVREAQELADWRGSFAAAS